MSTLFNPTKKLSMAYVVLKTLDNNPIHIRALALKLGINPTTLKALCGELVKSHLIKSIRGTNGGVFLDAPPNYNELLRVFRKGFIFSESYHEKLTKFFYENYTKKMKVRSRSSPPCEICEESGKVLLPEGTCLDCEKYSDANFLPKKKLAKCGHYSNTRYFNCTVCEPHIEGGIFDVYHVALAPNQSALQSDAG